MLSKVFAYFTLIQVIRCLTVNEQDRINLNASLNIITSLPLTLTIYYRNFECNKCKLTVLYSNLNMQDNNVTVQIRAVNRSD